MIQPYAETEANSVLIVEDDADAAEALRDYLEPHGFEAHLAHDLAQAERTLSDPGAQVVLLDVRLGSEFGLDLITRIQVQHPGTLFIVMTAFARSDVAIEALRRGAHDFVRKPLDPAALVATLTRTFDLVRARAARELAVFELAQSEANMRMAEQVGQFGSWSLDLRTGVGHWSEQHCRMFGVDPKTFVPTPESLLAVVHPEDRAAMQAAFVELASSQGTVSAEYRIVRPDGTIRTMHSAAKVAVEPDGTPARWFGMVQDITERRDAEQELLRSESRLRQALDIAELGTFEWRLADKEVHLSPETCSILGLPCADDAGIVEQETGLMKFVHPKDSAVAGEAFRQAIDNAAPFKLEFRVVRPGGEIRTVESTGQLISDSRGRASSLLGILRDVTEHRLLEQQFRQAQKMEAVGSLAGGVAHDLNNMLQVIRGYVELELRQVTDRKLPVGGMERALQATDSASRMIQQLLAFSRSQVLRVQAVDFNDLIGQQAQMLRRLIRQDIEIAVVPAPSPAIVSADKGMLEQVIMNLCVNARDAMADGGQLTLEISRQQADGEFCVTNSWARPGPYVVVRVIDTGTGMAPEVTQRIFEPFFTTKEVGKGTGLGLAMVYGIVQQHEGMVTVESEPGKGTTFSIYLPGHEAEPIQDESPAERHIVGGTETILVVEDQAAVRDLVVTILEGEGYRVLTAPDGETALEVFRTHRDSIDLALLDVVMPKLGGVKLSERLLAQCPQLPIVFSTGHAGEPEDRDFVDKSGLPVVRKPYAPAELLQVVRRQLDRRADESS